MKDSDYTIYEPTPFKKRVWTPILPSEDHFNRIDINNKLVEDINNETQSRLDLYNIPVEKTYLPSRLVGMEVGDDRVDFCSNPITLARMLAIQSLVFKMKTSEKDTFISSNSWNFCEVTSQIPSCPQESLEFAKKHMFNQLGFTDVPTLRIIIDAQKFDRSHSSTAVGKTSLLGNRMSTPRTEHKPTLMLASWVQDSTLRTSHITEPKYLHKQVGGSGCGPLYGSPENTYLYMQAFKNGTYARIYGSAINEAKTAVMEMDLKRPSAAVLCQRLRDRKEYLHITYASSILIPDKMTGDLPRPLYKASGTSNLIQGTENRLKSTKRLIDGRSALVEWRRRERILDTLFGYNAINVIELANKMDNQLERRKYDGALNANSAIQNLLRRQASGNEVNTLLEEGFIHATTGVVDITLELIQWMHEGGKGEVFSISDITLSQDMYLRSEISLEETMKVSNIPLNPIFNNRSGKTLLTISKVGLWQVSEQLEEWSDRVTQELVQLRAEKPFLPAFNDVSEIYINNREYVADDPLLIAECIRLTARSPRSTVILLTTDKKLCRNMAMTTNNYVMCLSPIELLRRKPASVWSSEVKLTPGEVNNIIGINLEFPNFPKPVYVLIDTGSLQAHATLLESEIDQFGRDIPFKTKVIETNFVSRKSIVQRTPLTLDSTVRVVLYLPDGTQRTATLSNEAGFKPTKLAASKRRRLSSNSSANW